MSWSWSKSPPSNRLLERSRSPLERRVLAMQRLQRDSFFLLRSVAVWPAPTSRRDTTRVLSAGGRATDRLCRVTFCFFLGEHMCAPARQQLGRAPPRGRVVPPKCGVSPDRLPQPGAVYPGDPVGLTSETESVGPHPRTPEGNHVLPMQEKLRPRPWVFLTR